MLKENIKKIEADAEKTKMSAEQYYGRMKKAGVNSFKVELTTGKIYYYGEDEIFIDQEPKKYKIGKMFNKETVAKAYKDGLAEKINYITFQEIIAKEGCDHYVGDLKKDTNTFYNKDESAKTAVKIQFPKK